ncbi:hypothetical protein N7493_001661 [Penicillium malachiteum]|uniref:DUF3500 domain-containing protein n=1 Tax=Penicillium malachiteum TaxID=1324776 RepID=A0AAD6HUU4_9EURO|nr:hypothetical protein N7493_001661 [Penicillium malachiteum]
MPISFRDFVPPPKQHPRLGDINFADYNIHTWAEWGMKQSFVKTLWEGWQKLYKEPFRGITTDGEVIQNLFHLRGECAPIGAMQKAARSLVAVAEEEGTFGNMRLNIEADEWRRWMNPEFYFAKCGIRLEEQSEQVKNAMLTLIESSLSPKGYQKILDCMKINGFLGALIGAPHLMNEGSYNFILFGEPSVTEPWGWSLWGHHVSVCCFVLEDQMVMSPVFFGCEPNQIDSGEYAGTEVFSLEMQLAVRLMQSLSEENKKAAIAYDQLQHPSMPPNFPHPADGRNLAGAYEDNRVIPYSGVKASSFSETSRELLMQLIEKFIDFIPEGPLTAKLSDVRAHLEDTWLMWMGKYTDQDPFHFRINSPVIICEFDHECGMYLSNAAPARFHIHTLVRTPNGNDYGKELLRLWKEKNNF